MKSQIMIYEGKSSKTSMTTIKRVIVGNSLISVYRIFVEEPVLR